VDGDDGDSAYQIWLNLGNTGTEQDFIDALKGDPGQDVDHVSFTSTTGTGQGEPGETDTYTFWADAGETISLGTFTVTNGANGAAGADGMDLYDSGWVQIGNHKGRFGFAPFTGGWAHPKIRVIGRHVYINGRVLIPLASDGSGLTLIPDNSDYADTNRIYVRTYEGTDGGFVTNPDGAILSQSPIIPTNLTPTEGIYTGYNQVITRAVRDKVGTYGLNLTTMFPLIEFRTDGKISITTHKDVDDSATSGGGGSLNVPNSPFHEIITSVLADEYVPDYTNYKPSYSKATSGALVVGRTYILETFVAGDDFTNVGAPSNTSGVVFIATGTTPTTWTNASTITTDNRIIAPSNYQYPATFDGENEEHLGGFVIPFTFSYPLADTVTEAQIIAAIASI
jgi:hypothetical protein